jgi:threonine/homoserine/homoserine lactone efflux protein
MTIDPQIVAFTGVAALLTMTPGADTMLVIRSVITRGQRAGAMATLGVCSGLFVHASLSALGISALLLASELAFNALALAGAIYLVGLGAQSIRRSLAGQPAAGTSGIFVTPGSARQPAWRSFRDGLMTNVLNPKVSVFYLAFLPQFISPGDPVLARSILLAAIHATMGVTWLLLVVFFLGKMGSLLSRPLVQRRLEGFTGVVLVGLGLRVAMESR